MNDTISEYEFTVHAMQGIDFPGDTAVGLLATGWFLAKYSPDTLESAEAYTQALLEDDLETIAQLLVGDLDEDD